MNSWALQKYMRSVLIRTPLLGIQVKSLICFCKTNKKLGIYEKKKKKMRRI